GCRSNSIRFFDSNPQKCSEHAIHLHPWTEYTVHNSQAQQQTEKQSRSVDLEFSPLLPTDSFGTSNQHRASMVIHSIESVCANVMPVSGLVNCLKRTGSIAKSERQPRPYESFRIENPTATPRTPGSYMYIQGHDIISEVRRVDNQWFACHLLCVRENKRFNTLNLCGPTKTIDSVNGVSIRSKTNRE
ncbi:hypothetical protein CLF_110141, partial [Clonorchis sinensis]